MSDEQKRIRIIDLRDILMRLNDEEISFSKAVELLNEKAGNGPSSAEVEARVAAAREEGFSDGWEAALDWAHEMSSELEYSSRQLDEAFARALAARRPEEKP